MFESLISLETVVTMALHTSFTTWASIISTHHLSGRQFLNQYCFFFLVFFYCLENSFFLIRSSSETKILIIFLSLFCLCILNVKSLVNNYREVVNKTIICCCKHCSFFAVSICYLWYFINFKTGWHRADPF